MAAGWVTSYQARHDLENGYAARLGRLLESRGYRVVNVSVPGNSTADVLARMDQDLEPTGAGIVLIGLSLGNERLTEDRDAGMAAYAAKLPRIIERCREGGRIPVVGLCYPCDEYDAEDYAALKRMNSLIESWGVPAVNFLGALDDGAGHFVQGCTFDEGHPDNRGHEELFFAVVPSLFDALLAKKPLPERPAASGHVTLRQGEDPAALSFVPADEMHSFAFGLSFRAEQEGAIAAIQTGGGFATLDIGLEGRVVYTGVDGETILGPAGAANGEWHGVLASHGHLLGRTRLFVDGELAGEVEERLEPLCFVLGDSGQDDFPCPAEADYRDWLVDRAALCADEAAALQQGSLLRASLELYAPLREEKLAAGADLENRAWSTAVARALPRGAGEDLSRLAARIEEARAAREHEFVAEEKPEVAVDPSVLEAYAGKYEIAPGDRMEIAREGDRLFLVDRGQRVRLYAESDARFFIRTVGEVTIAFERNADNEVSGLVLAAGGQEIPAKRVR